jgi:hypothetical protein
MWFALVVCSLALPQLPTQPIATNHTSQTLFVCGQARLPGLCPFCEARESFATEAGSCVAGLEQEDQPEISNDDM